MENTVGDLLVRIRNASMARHRSLELAYSSFAERLAQFLVDRGRLEKVSITGEKGQRRLKIDLKYQGKRPLLGQVRQISKPGRRVYFKAREVSHLRRTGPSLVILSTSKGLKALDEAKREKIGGELLGEVW